MIEGTLKLFLKTMLQEGDLALEVDFMLASLFLGVNN